MNKYYVYILYREDGITPFYVGKGTRNRWLRHEYEVRPGHSHKDNIVWSMKSRGILVPKKKIAENLTNEEAIRLEVELIEKYKRICDGGILTNLTTGGDGGREGDIDSEETRAKKSAAMKGRPFSEETRAKMSAAGKRRIRVPMSEEHKAKISSALIGHTVSEESRAKMSAAKKGHPRPGGPLSEEHKAKISASKKGKPKSIEMRAKLSTAKKGKPGHRHSEETKAKMSASARLRNKFK